MPSRAASRAEQRRRARRTTPTTGRRVRERWWWIGAVVLGSILLLGLYLLTRPAAAPTGSKPPGTETFTEKDRKHVAGAVRYDRTPPAGGDHAQVWLNCGVYDAPVPNENAVHSLEHGAVWITYRPDLPPGDVQALRTLAVSKYDGADRYVVLSPFPGLPAPLVATAWGNQLRLEHASDPRLGSFIDYFRQGPQDLEQGASCSGGAGTPSA